MPIEGLSKTKMPFPEIGRIRKGAKKIDKKKPGSDLKYFRVEFAPGEEEAAETFRAAYPTDEPQKINIYFPFKEVNDNWYCYLDAFLAGGLYAQSDRKIYQFVRDGISGEVLVANGLDVSTGEPRPYVKGEPATYYIDGKGKKQPLFCKPHGLLSVMVIELYRAASLMVVTNSWNDVTQITNQLNFMYKWFGESLQGVPIEMSRKPQMISTPGDDGKRVRREKWLIQLEVMPKFAKERFKELEKTRFPMLEAGNDWVDEGDDEAIKVEYKAVGSPSSKPVVEGNVIRWTSHQLGLVVAKKLAKDMAHAQEGLDKSALPMDVSDEMLIRWMRKYQAHVDEGESAEQAAARANAAYEKAVRRVQ